MIVYTVNTSWDLGFGKEFEIIGVYSTLERAQEILSLKYNRDLKEELFFEDDSYDISKKDYYISVIHLEGDYEWVDYWISSYELDK